MEYLAIKNWEKYQVSRKGKAVWIKDYTSKDRDEDYSQLSPVQRYMLDGICRLRGEMGRNLTNDVLWICRALAVRPQDRHNCVAAIGQLIGSGFLVVTNQQDVIPLHKNREEIREEEKREDETLASELPPSALAQKVIHETGVAANPQMLIAVSGAVEFCVKHEGKSKNAAVEFLIAQCKDEIDRGGMPNKFWFDDRKWRHIGLPPPREAQSKAMLRRVFSETD